MKKVSADRLIRIAVALSTEKDLSALLDRILTEAMDITECDGGTVYTRDGDHLQFDNMITLSRGVHRIRQSGGELLPPVPLDRAHVCACAALENRLFNIPDVYRAEEFDFSGTRRYDAMNGYRTESMLVVPMEDERGHCIGVLQLINALGREGEIVPFPKEAEEILRALASLAAVSLSNARLQQAVEDILQSFVTVMVDAIDARTPYNATHTRNMVGYARRFLEWLDREDHGWQIGGEEKKPFLMSIWLHDIGKLVIPLEIMDKTTRLGALEAPLQARIRVGVLMERLRALEKPQEAEAAREKQEALGRASEIIGRINRASFLTEEDVAELRRIAGISCLTAEGNPVPLLTGNEFTALSVRRGTLTEAERKEIQRHVEYTKKLLGEMKFSGIYESVPLWAGEHHELLDGSGYPEALTAERLPGEVRLLTILDIYDALTAEDRPYKPPMTPEKAFSVLESMRDEGKVDGEILRLFRESEAWKK